MFIVVVGVKMLLDFPLVRHDLTAREKIEKSYGLDSSSLEEEAKDL